MNKHRREPVDKEVAEAAIARSKNLVSQLMTDVPQFLSTLIELDVPESAIEEYGDIMQLFGETLGTMAIIVRYAYRDTVD